MFIRYKNLTIRNAVSADAEQLCAWYYGYEKMILDTNLKNERAQHVYEKKLGFRRVGIETDAWQDQLGEWNSIVNYEMSKADWLASRRELPDYICNIPESVSE